MRASSSRVHASGIEQNISSRNELAHNRTIHSKRGGAYLSLSPTAGHYLIVLARFVYQTMPCFLYRPVSPIRFAESFHAQYTNPLRNESAPSSNRWNITKYRQNRFIKTVVDVQYHFINHLIKFPIFPNPQTIAIIISFIRIIFPCTDSFEDGWNNFLISTPFLYYSE